jgi:uncharacterized protein
MTERDSQAPTTDRAPGRWRRRLLKTLLIVVIVWLASTAATDWILTRRFRGPRPEPAPSLNGIEIESCRLRTSDGEQLGGWFIPGRPGAPSVLLLHGIDSNRGDFVPMLAPLNADGYNVLAITLRAHGDSTGKKIDFGYSSAKDVVAAMEFLERRFPGGRIILCGRSLGAAAALFAAPQLGSRVQGYLLESPYQDLNTAVKNRLRHLPRPIDTIGFIGLRMWAPLFLDIAPEKICPRDCAESIPQSVPVVILSGTADRDATIPEAEAILNKLQSHAVLIKFPGASHATLYRSDPDLYYRTLRDLIEQPTSLIPRS